MTYQETKLLRLQNTSQKIPLFKDVLSLINGKDAIIIEIEILTPETRKIIINNWPYTTDIFKEYTKWKL